MDLSDILSSACELAILGVRADQHAALSITEFVEIFKENWEFVVATETLAKRMIVSLRGVTASQVCLPMSNVPKQSLIYRPILF
jgi:vacuolar protein sorting-associated protein 54